METLKELTVNELLKRLANATITQYSCGGHNKANQNEMKANRIEAELRSRGWNIPSLDNLLDKGIFNGIGSV